MVNIIPRNTKTLQQVFSRAKPFENPIASGAGIYYYSGAKITKLAVDQGMDGYDGWMMG